MAKKGSDRPASGVPDLTDARSLLSVKTRLGLCGVGFIGGRVGRLWLPGGNENRLKSAMDDWAGGCSHGRDGVAGSIYPLLADEISRYFEGGRVGFEDVEVALPGFSGFTRMVLEGIRRVEWGNAVTYKNIASSMGHPGSARAIGMIMSKNPVPLIIPCHRVIRSDGGLGGFSGPGGVVMKKRMLLLEGFGK